MSTDVEKLILRSVPDRIYVWFDDMGRIIQLTESRGINAPPELPGYVEFTGAPIAEELRRRPGRFYRNKTGNLEHRQPVRIVLSKRVIIADGEDFLVARVLGVDRPVRVRVGDQEAVIDQDGLTITTETTGMLRVALHEDELDLFEEERSNSFAVARRPPGKPDEVPTPGP